jgi:hypothetical protein
MAFEGERSPGLVQFQAVHGARAGVRADWGTSGLAAAGGGLIGVLAMTRPATWSREVQLLPAPRRDDA